MSRSVPRDLYEVIEFGDRYEELVAILRAASAASRAAVVGFHDMSPEQVSLRCGLPLEQAILAQRREYDEPFEVTTPDRIPELLRAIERRGKRWTRGGRFYHITGNNDKAQAVRCVAELYARSHQNVLTVGLGDSLNDADFLAVVDIPILIRSPRVEDLRQKVPHGRITELAGPAGWNQAILAGY